MAEWWENLTSGAQNVAGDIQRNLSSFGRDLGLGALRGTFSALRSNPLTMAGTSFLDNAYLTGQALSGGPVPAGSLASRLQEAAGMAPQPQSFGGPDRFAGAQMLPQVDLSDPQEYMGMTQEELLAYLLDSGGGPDLSGYNAMLEDITGREGALGTRKAEQQAFLTSLFDAAESRAEADRTALAAAVDAQLTSDAERRAAEMGVVRQGDVNRAASATAAREALGAPTGPDLTSNVVENVASGVAAGGAIADRDARIRESIANQQLTREISSLTPMEQMAVMGLNRQYEDRLAGLASERAAIQAQMAAARSANRGPSVSERIGAMQFAGDVFAPAEAAQYELPGLQQGQQAIAQFYGPQVAADIAGIGDRILSSAVMSTIDPTKPAGVSELLQNIRSQDPAIDSYLNQNPSFAAMVVNYVVEAGKGY